VDLYDLFEESHLALDVRARVSDVSDLQQRLRTVGKCPRLFGVEGIGTITTG
jgi:hypothetical protein